MRLSALAFFLTVQTTSARNNARARKTLEATISTAETFDASHLTGDAIDDIGTDSLADDLGAIDEKVQEEIQDLEDELSKIEELLEGPESDGTDEPGVCENQAEIDASLADPTTCEPGKYAVQDGCEVECEDCFSGDNEPCLNEDMDIFFAVPGSCSDYECLCEDGKELNADYTACVCVPPTEPCPEGMEWDEDDCECDEISTEEKEEKAERGKPEKPQKPDKPDKPDNSKKPVKRNLRA